MSLQLMYAILIFKCMDACLQIDNYLLLLKEVKKTYFVFQFYFNMAKIYIKQILAEAKIDSDVVVRA